MPAATSLRGNIPVLATQFMCVGSIVISAPVRPPPPRSKLLPPAPGVESPIDPENEYRTDDRQDPAVPGIAGERERFARSPLNQPVKKAAHEGSDDAKDHRQEQAEMLSAAHQQVGNQSHNQAAQHPAEYHAYAHVSHSSSIDAKGPLTLPAVVTPAVFTLGAFEAFGVTARLIASARVDQHAGHVLGL